jgi:DNA-binding NarL/FixJ family response regulator
VARTRVVLAAMPTMLAGIVRELLVPHPDLEIVAEVGARADLPALLATVSATIAIVGLAVGESPAVYATLLRAHPELTILAITADGRTAYHCAMRMQVSVTTELSATQLLQALRARGGVDRDLHLFSLHWPIPAADPAPDN